MLFKFAIAIERNRSKGRVTGERSKGSENEEWRKEGRVGTYKSSVGSRAIEGDNGGTDKALMTRRNQKSRIIRHA